MRKRILAIVAAMAMVMTMVPAMVFAATTVNDANGLVGALENGEDVVFATDIKIDPAKLSNAYGTTGINVKTGQTIDGNGKTLDIAGAGGTWDSGINTTGGVIKNLTVTGAFRGIFVNHNSSHFEKVILENVTIDGTVYTISCDQAKDQTLEATNCTFNGWTSYAATIGSVTFTKCNFGEGSGYAYLRPYAPTTLTNCNFEKGYAMDARQTSGITLINCYMDDTLITEENLTELLGANAANASVENYDVPDVDVEDIPTIDTTKPAEKVEVGTTEAAKNVLEETIETIIGTILKGDSVENVDSAIVDAIKDAIKEGAEVTISTNVVVTPLAEKDVDKNDAELIDEAAEDATIAQYLDLSVYMTVMVDGKNVETGKVSELTEEITFTIAIPEELKNTAKDVTRSFFVIKVHEGEVETLPATETDEGLLSFETGEFSTYALAYEDTVKSTGGETNTPAEPSDKATQTGDTSDMTVPFALAGLAAIAMAAVVLARRKQSQK